MQSRVDSTPAPDCEKDLRAERYLRLRAVVIGIYSPLMVVVGLYVMRFNRGAAEYFRGGNRIPWLIAGLSCFMSGAPGRLPAPLVSLIGLE
jgi:hypothetical protein